MNCNVIRKIRKQLMDRIDTSDLVEVAKVERYCELLQLNDRLNQAIEEDGPVVDIHNGTQVFKKSHPAIADKMKLSTQIIALEKSIKFVEGKKKIENKQELKKIKGGLI